MKRSAQSSCRVAFDCFSSNWNRCHRIVEIDHVVDCYHRIGSSLLRFVTRGSSKMKGYRFRSKRRRCPPISASSSIARTFANQSAKNRRALARTYAILYLLILEPPAKHSNVFRSRRRDLPRSIDRSIDRLSGPSFAAAVQRNIFKKISRSVNTIRLAFPTRGLRVPRSEFEERRETVALVIHK